MAYPRLSGRGWAVLFVLFAVLVDTYPLLAVLILVVFVCRYITRRDSGVGPAGLLDAINEFFLGD